MYNRASETETRNIRRVLPLSFTKLKRVDRWVEMGAVTCISDKGFHGHEKFKMCSICTYTIVSAFFSLSIMSIELLVVNTVFEPHEYLFSE